MRRPSVDENPLVFILKCCISGSKFELFLAPFVFPTLDMPRGDKKKGVNTEGCCEREQHHCTEIDVVSSLDCEGTEVQTHYETRTESHTHQCAR